MIGANLLDITMSLDRFVAAPNVGVPQPFGEEWKCLHNWLFGDRTTAPTEADREVIQGMFAQAGALVMGRHTSTSEKDHGAMTRLFDHIGPERLPLEKTRVIESPWLPISFFASITGRRGFLPAGIRPRLHEEELIWQSDSLL